MEIKYLRDAPLGKKGQTATVQDYEGNVLVLLGFAKEVKPKVKEEMLLNLNGTPVIDDFGTMALTAVK